MLSLDLVEATSPLDRMSTLCRGQVEGRVSSYECILVLVDETIGRVDALRVPPQYQREHAALRLELRELALTLRGPTMTTSDAIRQTDKVFAARRALLSAYDGSAKVGD